MTLRRSSRRSPPRRAPRSRRARRGAAAAPDRRPGEAGPAGAGRPRRDHRHRVGRAADAGGSPRAPLRRPPRPRRRGTHLDGLAPRREARHRGAPRRRPARAHRPRDVSVSRAAMARRLDRGQDLRGRVPRRLVPELGLQLALLPRHLSLRAGAPPADGRDQCASVDRRQGAAEGLREPDAGGGRAHPEADRHEEPRSPSALQGLLRRGGELSHGRQRRAVAGDAERAVHLGRDDGVERGRSRCRRTRTRRP